MTRDYTPGGPGVGRQPAPMNAPTAADLSIGVQPGTPNIIRAFQVIIAGGANSGLFVYSPSAGLNKLVASITNTLTGTDPYGNVTHGPGFAAYAGQAANDLVSALRAGVLRMGTNTTINTGQDATVASDSAGHNLVLQSGSTGTDGTEIQQTLTQIIVQAQGITVGDPLMNVIGNLAVQGVLELPSQGTPLALAGNALLFAGTGHEKYVAPNGVSFNTGRNTQPASAPLNLTTSFQNIPSIGVNVENGITYHYRAQVLINNPGTAGQGAIGVQVAAGPTLTNGRYTAREVVANGTIWEDYTAIGNAINSPNAPSTTTNNRVWDLDAIFTCTGSGFFTFQMKQVATAACNTLQNGTYGELFPIS
jgi:hypothetical protein